MLEFKQMEELSMNYEKTILEMLERIKTLEEKVEKLAGSNAAFNNNEFMGNRKITMTQKAKDYIMHKKNEAKEHGYKEIVLLCNDIQKALNITNRTPIVCTAMYECMGSKDEIISSPPSGFSTTVKVKYYL